MRRIVIKDKRLHIHIARLIKWAGFQQDRLSGSLTSPNYYGFVVIMPDYYYIHLDSHTKYSRLMYPLSLPV